MEMKRRGFTLLELVIYVGLGALALGAILSLFMISRSAQQQTYTSSLVSGRVYTALRMLRRDLQETALASIEVYPNANDSAENPGLSMAGAYLGDKPTLEVSAFGAPRWEHTVFYTLKPQTGKTGTLVRWTKNYDTVNLLPQLDLSPPSAIDAATERTLVEDLLLPNLTIENVGEGGSYDSGPQGGLEVSYIRRNNGEAGEETLTTENPRSGDAADNTRLVQVKLKLLRDESHSKPSLFTMVLRVTPRY